MAWRPDGLAPGMLPRGFGAAGEELAQTGAIRQAPLQVLEAWAVGFAVWDELDLGSASRPPDDSLRQLANGDLFVGADIEDLADRLRVLRQPGDGRHHVADVAKAAPLAAI